MKNLFLTLVKIITLLIGIAMLIGGGLCSVVAPFLGGSADTIFLIPLGVIAAIVVGGFMVLTIKLPFSQQAKYFGLLIGIFFLVGGGLCSGSSSSQMMSGMFSIDIAVTLCGYLLVRWMLIKFKKRDSSAI
jgi:hypothetical protein